MHRHVEVILLSHILLLDYQHAVVPSAMDYQIGHAFLILINKRIFFEFNSEDKAFIISLQKSIYKVTQQILTIQSKCQANQQNNGVFFCDSSAVSLLSQFVYKIGRQEQVSTMGDQNDVNQSIQALWDIAIQSKFSMRKILHDLLTLQLMLIIMLLLNYSYQSCDVQRCTTCKPDDDDQCQTCNSGYLLVDDSCCKNTLQYCSRCTNDADRCDSCLNQSYFKVNGSCFPCTLSNCKTCSNITSCSTCEQNYGLDNLTQCGLCSSSMPLCLTCQNQTTCTSCVNDTYGVNRSSQCQICSSLMTYCTNCLSYHHCVSCSGSPLIFLNGNKCTSCSAAIPNCINCTNINHCTICNSYYLLLATATNSTCSLCLTLMNGCLNCSSTTVCVKCSVGRIVPMGCTSVPGCTSVFQSPPTSVCISCDFAQFQVIPVNGSCVCIRGHLAGQYCTEIAGCTNILRNSSGDFCITCSQRLYFLLENGTCICRQYFQFSGQACKQICGDGQVYVLPCDDGNLIDGDGCSSSCSVESGYSCRTGANNSASACKYQGLIKAKLDCIHKLDDPNTANIVINFSPFISNMLKINFANYTAFNFTASCQVTSVSIVGSSLQVTVSYFQDFESSSATIIINYDPQYIRTPQSLIFTTIKECNGDRLIYDPDFRASYRSMISFLARIISISILILWLLGSYSHKLIGVETLHAIHIVFIMQAFAPRYRPAVLYFSELHSSTNFFQSLLTTSTPLSSSPYQQLNQGPNFIFNIGFVALLELLIISAFALVSLARFFSRGDSTINLNTARPKYNRLKKIQTFIYDFLLFPTLIGFFFSFIVSLQVNSTPSIAKSSNGDAHVATGILLTFSATAFVFFGQWRHLFLTKRSQKPANYHENYVAYYLTYILILSLTFSLSITQFIQYPLFSFAAISSTNLIAIIVYRPYQEKVHNVGLIVNQVVILFNLAWLISQDYIYLTRFMDQIAAFAVIAGLFLVFLLSLLRIIFQFRRRKDTEVIEKNVAQQRHIQSYDEYQRQIVKAIVSQTEANINYYRLTSLLLRERGHEENQSNDLQSQRFKQLLRMKLKFKFNEEEGGNIAYSSRTGHIHRK